MECGKQDTQKNAYGSVPPSGSNAGHNSTCGTNYGMMSRGTFSSPYASQYANGNSTYYHNSAQPSAVPPAWNMGRLNQYGSASAYSPSTLNHYNATAPQTRDNTPAWSPQTNPLTTTTAASPSPIAATVGVSSHGTTTMDPSQATRFNEHTNQRAEHNGYASQPPQTNSATNSPTPTQSDILRVRQASGELETQPTPKRIRVVAEKVNENVSAPPEDRKLRKPMHLTYPETNPPQLRNVETPPDPAVSDGMRPARKPRGAAQAEMATFKAQIRNQAIEALKKQSFERDQVIVATKIEVAPLKKKIRDETAKKDALVEEITRQEREEAERRERDALENDG